MYEIIGMRHAEYTNKQGKHVEGYEVNYTSDYPAGDGEGKRCDTAWVNADVFQLYQALLFVGSPAMPIFDNKGRLQGFMESPA